MGSSGRMETESPSFPFVPPNRKKGVFFLRRLKEIPRRLVLKILKIGFWI